MSHVVKLALCLTPLLLLPACDRQKGGHSTGEAVEVPAPAVAPPTSEPAPMLQDVIETTGSYIVGVSYGPEISKYPGLAEVVQSHAAQARAELMEAVEAFGNDEPPSPYELSLGYRTVLETPGLVAVSVDGSRYTGGAHAEPIVERFVWLPIQRRMLSSEQLIPNEESWSDIASYIREQLHTALSVRADRDRLAPEDRSRLVREADKNIREGTAPSAENFSSFEPRVDASGKITGLRFIFPPYQVGPYVDGTQTVDVPTEVLLPHVASEYRGLFAGG